MAGKCGKAIVSPLQYSGTINSGLFEYWFEYMLMNDVPAGSVIVMDNALFHPKILASPSVDDNLSDCFYRYSTIKRYPYSKFVF